MNVRARAQDAFATLCRLYGDAKVAQALMGVRGACCPRVARLANTLGSCPAAVKAAREYPKLFSLRIGFRRFEAAAKGSRLVIGLVQTAARGEKFSPWEIDTAIKILNRKES